MIKLLNDNLFTSLSNASKQSLLSIVRNQINHEQKTLKYFVADAKYFYELADKNNPNTINDFLQLNYYRDMVRQSKNALNN